MRIFVTSEDRAYLPATYGNYDSAWSTKKEATAAKKWQESLGKGATIVKGYRKKIPTTMFGRTTGSSVHTYYAVYVWGREPRRK